MSKGLSQTGQGKSIVEQLAEQQGITENLMLWVQQMNNVQNVAAEIVLNELIYC